MIYHMFATETEKFHNTMVNNHKNGNKIPLGILEKDIYKLDNSGTSRPNLCCHQ